MNKMAGNMDVQSIPVVGYGVFEYLPRRGITRSRGKKMDGFGKYIK